MLIVAIKKKKEGGRENEIYFCELMHLSECVQTIFFIFTFKSIIFYFLFFQIPYKLPGRRVRIYVHIYIIMMTRYKNIFLKKSYLPLSPLFCCFILLCGIIFINDYLVLKNLLLLPINLLQYLLLLLQMMLYCC